MTIHWKRPKETIPTNGHNMGSGLQLRKSEQNCFHDNFLVSQPNPMMRDDSNEWSHHRVWLRNKKDSILKTLNFRPHLLAWAFLQIQI